MTQSDAGEGEGEGQTPTCFDAATQDYPTSEGKEFRRILCL